MSGRGEAARFDPELLVAHLGWIRRLALELARDPEVADDLVQETLVVALERPPRSARALRAWLGTVLANLARQRGRREGTRRVHEHRHAAESGRERSDAMEADATMESEDALATARAVVSAVGALSEPYRRTLLLRYFEGLPPRRIAARDGVPVKTVDTRLRRAHALLRERLDREHGRDRWAPALLPLLRRGEPASAAAGAAFPAGAAWLAAAAVLGAAGLFAVHLGSSGPSREPERGAAPEVAVLDAPATAPAGATAEREPVPVPPSPAHASVPERLAARAPEPPGPPAPAAPSFHPVSGRVLDAEGRPLGGARVRAEEARSTIAPGVAFVRDVSLPVARTGSVLAETRSAADGSFALRVPLADGPALAVVVEVAGDEHASLLAALQATDVPPEPVVLVAARRVRVEGSVQDPSGAPLAGVRIEWFPPAGFEARYDERLVGKLLAGPAATSDELGRFALAVPELDGARLVATAAGRLESARPAPTAARASVLFVLREPPPSSDWVAGTVVSEWGRPVAGARVTLGDALESTAADGSFVLERVAGAATLRAYAYGVLPGEVPVPPPGAEARDLRVELGGPAPDIRGRVLDERGRPIAGVVVWPGNPILAARAGGGVPVLAEHLTTDRGGEPWFRAETGANGEFVLSGLLERDYRLRVLDLATLDFSESEPIPAGEADAELRLERAHGELAGVVVALDGTPLAGIEVFAARPVLVLDTPWLGRDYSVSHGTAGVRTGVDGSFRLTDVDPVGVRVAAQGSGVWPGDVEVLPGAETRVRIELGRECFLRVVCAEGAGAPDRFATLDESGRPCTMLRSAGAEGILHEWARITDGSSVVTTVKEYAREVLLYRVGEEVARVPFVPRAGETVTVTWP